MKKLVVLLFCISVLFMFVAATPASAESTTGESVLIDVYPRTFESTFLTSSDGSIYPVGSSPFSINSARYYITGTTTEEVPVSPDGTYSFGYRNYYNFHFYLNMNLRFRNYVWFYYSGVLRDYLRFTTKSAVRAARNNHQSRLDTVSWWDDFLGSVEALPQLYIDGGHYDLNDVEYFIRRQTSSSLKLWLEAHNGDMTDLMDIIEHARLNKRQSMLLSEIRRDMIEKKEE